MKGCVLKQVIHLIDLSLAEPDPRLFEVPSGYIVSDERIGAHAQR